VSALFFFSFIMCLRFLRIHIAFSVYSLNLNENRNIYHISSLENGLCEFTGAAISTSTTTSSSSSTSRIKVVVITSAAAAVVVAAIIIYLIIHPKLVTSIPVGSSKLFWGFVLGQAERGFSNKLALFTRSV
jgi:hypothetical protein